MGDTPRTDDTRRDTAPDPWLSIGAFSRRSLLSPKALRLYDRLEILSPAEVNPGNGYRRYRESQLDTARLIARLRQLDMPLAQVAAIVSAQVDRRSEALIAYWDDVERRIAAQREILVHLLIALSGKERSFDMYEIQERDVPEQLMLTEQRYVSINDLTSWMSESIGRMWEIAPRFGGITGPVLAIFHGEVNPDSDGPVEICAPIDSHQPAVPIPNRIEPAHREAYTRLRKSQVQFPEIISAYDAVEQWIGQQGKMISGPPREVYFTDFMNAGPDDEVVDVAFPIEHAAGR